VGERSSFTPGTFCWVDLTTPDPAGAKAFYQALFGWEADDVPMGDDGSVYSMMKVDGKLVCAISPQNENQTGLPPIWNSYVCVADADSVLESAKELGATVHAPAFDVFDAGRMAVLQDPQGAFVLLWQPGQHTGAQLVNSPGAFCWNELYTPDMDASARFYSELFGWAVEPFAESPMPYLIIQNGGHANGGITEVQEGMPPAWLAYFVVADIDDGLAKVGELGGVTIVGPIDIGMAKLGIVRDPQGGVFALYAGRLDD
jgi:predicted enzyme related to lactoylglutathione lyase